MSDLDSAMSDETAPAIERYESVQDVVDQTRARAAKAEAEPVEVEADDDYDPEEAGETPAALDLLLAEADDDAEEEDDEPEPVKAKTKTKEPAAPSKILLDGEEYDPEDVKEWKALHKSASSFERILSEKQKEMKGVYETLTSEEKRLKEEASRLDQYRKYLVKQGIEAGDPLSAEIGEGEDLDDQPTAKRGKKALTVDDLEEWYETRRSRERETETHERKSERLRSNFDTYVNDALDTAGMEKGTHEHDLAREALAFRFYSKFQGDQKAVLEMSEQEHRAIIERDARDIGKRSRAAKEKAKSTMLDGMTSGKKRVPATPRVAGTPTPDQAAPGRRNSVAERFTRLGGLDGYFAEVLRESKRKNS